MGGLLWPHGSGHLCLKTHYGGAINQVKCDPFPAQFPIQFHRVLIFSRSQLYPREGCGWTEEEKEDGIQNYLLMKDMEALQVRFDHVAAHASVPSNSGNFGPLVEQSHDQ